MSSAARFLKDVESFLRRSGMSPTRFGTEAVGDPGFVADLRAGRCPRLDSADRVRKYINIRHRAGNGNGDTAKRA